MLTALKRIGRPASRLRRKPRAVLPRPAPVNHDAHATADPYAFEAAHRRLAWMFRISAMFNIGLFAVVIIQTAAIAELVPLKEVQLGLIRVEPRTDQAVTIDPAERVRVLPITRETPGFDLLLESFVRRYVRILLEIDTVSQGDRMREANLHSDADWWKRFVAERKKEIDRAQGTGLDRSVVVESADRISLHDGIARYAVDVVQTDKRDGQVVESKRLRAYIAVTSRPHTVRPSEKYENPLGIRVLDLSLKERGNS